MQFEERPLNVIDKWKSSSDAQLIVRLTPQPPQSAHQAHARVTPIPTLRSALSNNKSKQTHSIDDETNLKSPQSKTDYTKSENFHNAETKINKTTSMLSNLSLQSSSSTYSNFSPSTTITICSNGISTVQNNSSVSSSSSPANELSLDDEEPPSPPLRAPRRGVIANPSLLSRRQVRFLNFFLGVTN